MSDSRSGKEAGRARPREASDARGREDASGVLEAPAAPTSGEIAIPTSGQATQGLAAEEAVSVLEARPGGEADFFDSSLDGDTSRMVLTEDPGEEGPTLEVVISREGPSGSSRFQADSRELEGEDTSSRLSAGSAPQSAVYEIPAWGQTSVTVLTDGAAGDDGVYEVGDHDFEYADELPREDTRRLSLADLEFVAPGPSGGFESVQVADASRDYLGAGAEVGGDPEQGAARPRKSPDSEFESQEFPNTPVERPSRLRKGGAAVSRELAAGAGISQMRPAPVKHSFIAKEDTVVVAPGRAAALRNALALGAVALAFVGTMGALGAACMWGWEQYYAEQLAAAVPVQVDSPAAENPPEAPAPAVLWQPIVEPLDVPVRQVQSAPEPPEENGGGVALPPEKRNVDQGAAGTRKRAKVAGRSVSRRRRASASRRLRAKARTKAAKGERGPQKGRKSPKATSAPAAAGDDAVAPAEGRAKNAGNTPSDSASERATPDAPTAPAGAPLPEAPTQDAVRRVIDAAMPQLQRCAGEAHGTARLQLTVRGNGRVSHVLVGGDFRGTPEGTCLAKVVRHLRMPKFTRSRARVSYPVSL